MQKILAGEFFVDLIRMGMVEALCGQPGRPGPSDRSGGAELGGRVAGAILELPSRPPQPPPTSLLADDAAGYRASSRGAWPRRDRVAADDFEVLRIDRTRPALRPRATRRRRTRSTFDRPFDCSGDLPAWFDELGERPLVYVTLGTVFNGNVPLFRLIADALATSRST